MSVLKKILIAFFVGFSFTTSAQEYGEKIPKKAGLYSAILPGAGQVYTKKYWKVPVIYGGLITSAYYINESNDLYQLYKSTYLNRLDGDFNDNLNYSDSDLRTLTEHYRRNREVSALLFTLTYILNIVDATVNAHLFDYDVSEDLSLHIQPVYFSKENASGFSLFFNL
ncbi:MAG: DUF5683 domain-containing protein [Flavobacteriales bacterium]|nr:DUF5683 domain-containing protein [Flavobacteriales bacterium]